VAKVSPAMKKFAEFIESFVNEEYACWLLAYTERDTELFQSKINNFKKIFYEGDIYVDIRRRNSVDETWFNEAKTFLSGTQKRLIFQLKRYLIPKYGDIHAAYLSTADAGGNTYFLLVICQKINEDFKIISIAHTDFEGYFEHHDGIEFEQLPRPLEVVKFQPPADPADLEEYNAE
jgi:hypothetical protein